MTASIVRRIFLVAALPVISMILGVFSLPSDLSAAARIGILPFGNYTNTNSAPDSLTPLIQEQLTSRGFVAVSHDSIRNFMRHQRLRTMGMVSSKETELLRDNLSLDYLITGSLDFYAAQANPEVGLSVRVIDCHSLAIVWAASHSATGEDYAGMFGAGRISSLSKLSERVIDDLFKSFPLDKDLTARSGDPWRHGAKESQKERIAIVPFDNVSGYFHAGEIANGLLISRLCEDGFQILEPGDVAAVLADLRSTPRGKVSSLEIAQLRDKLNATVILTGAVYGFAVAGGAETGAQVEIGMRLIDAATGKVVASTTSVKKEADTETIFGAGREYSLGKLTSESLESAWKSLQKDRAKHTSLANHPGTEGDTTNGNR